MSSRFIKGAANTGGIHQLYTGFLHCNRFRHRVARGGCGVARSLSSRLNKLDLPTLGRPTIERQSLMDQLPL